MNNEAIMRMLVLVLVALALIGAMTGGKDK